MLSERPSILVTTDFSPASTEAFDLAQTLARRMSGRVILLFVYSPSGPPLVPGISKQQQDELHQSHRERAREELERLSVAFFGDLVERTIVLEGVASKAIVRFASEYPVDIIVMASHGGHGLRGTLLGSVCQRVLNHAPCPVMVVPASPSAEDNDSPRPSKEP